MSPDALLETCHGRNIELWNEDGQLRYRAPQGALDPQLAARLRENRQALLERLAIVPAWQADPGAAHERFPLTPVQAAYVLGRSTAFDYGGNACHIYLEHDWAPDTDVVAMERAWNAMVARHPMLRAIIEDNAWQRVQGEVPWQSLTVHDRRDDDPTGFAAHLAAIRDRLDHEIPALDRWPVLRPEISLGSVRCIVHLSVDFTIIDYASLQLLLAEWRRRHDDPQWTSEPLDATFRDYVMLDERRRKSAAFDRDRTWWLERLDTLPGRPDLPLRNDSDVRSTRFRHLHAGMEESAWRRFCDIAASFGISPTGGVLAAFAEVIGRWSQTPQFCLNLTVLNRPPYHSQLATVLGDFSALSLLAVDDEAGDCFVERARRIGAQMFDDLDHAAFGGVDVLRELVRHRGRGADLMPVVFTSGIGSLRHLAAGAAAALSAPAYMISQTPQVWLDCQVTDQFGGLEIGWDVREGLFPARQADDMFESFVRILGRLANDPAAWTDRGNPLWDTDAAPIPEALPRTRRSIAAGFAERALLMPDAPVIHDAAGTHSYRQISSRAAAVRRALQDVGVGLGERVAVMLPRSSWQLAAVLGVIQAGAAYIPVDVRQPVPRRTAIIADAGAAALICLADDAFAVPCPRVAIDSLSPDPQWPPLPGAAVDPDDLAYVIYTSGSTGTPKGVMLSHAAVSNTLADINARHEVGENDRVLGLAELSFDLSVYDLFGATAVGAQVILPDPERGNDPSHWAELMERHGVTFWNSVPAQGQMLIDYLERELNRAIPEPRCVLWSGDWIPASLPQRWWRRWPNSRLISLGGATEAAIWSIEQSILAEHGALPSIPYGHALSGQSVEVLDVRGRRCPPGRRGEIHIGGVGLALGYLGDPERTAERFIRHADGRRLYRTGDLGRYITDGAIEFLGREDDQVKIRGHRIELAEIDAALHTHADVKLATTIVVGERHERTLASFAILHSTGTGEAGVGHDLECVKEQAREAILGGWDPIDTIEDAVAALDRACLSSLADWIAPSGIFDGPARLDLTDFVSALGVPEPRRRLLTHWLHQLAESGYLISVDGGWQANPDRPGTPSDEAWKHFARIAPARIWPPLLIDYFRESANRLGEQIAGKVSPAALMFPEGSDRIAEAMYSDGLHARALHEAMATAVASIVARQPGRRWRLLELGAGTGAASRAVIAHLAPLVEQGIAIDYLFTDVSSYFLTTARERFGAHPWVRFARFDMNGDLADQGVAPCSLDIVLSSGALNNALDTPALLAGLRQLLGADAWLVIQELTREHNEIGISQSLMMENPRDGREEAGRLFVHARQWLEWLAAPDGDVATNVVTPGSPLDILGYDVLIARCKTDQARGDPAALLTFLETRLPRYMVPAQLHVVDRLPLTPNGKIDRKALAALARTRLSVTGSHSDDAPPRDEIESRLLALWRDVLGQPAIGTGQDFFGAGGDSLMIAQLIGRLRETLPEARRHPFDRLLRWALSEPTVRGLAGRLKQEVETGQTPSSPARRAPAPHTSENSPPRAPLRGRTADPLVRLVGGKGVPRVLVHEGLGTLLPYRGLIAALPRDRPLMGLAVHDSDAYLALPAAHVNASLGRGYADALYSADMREVDLLGYCSGGLVALEMAKALVQRQVRVRQLDIVSSYRIPYRIDDERLILFNFAATLGLDTTALGFPNAERLSQLVADTLRASPCCLAEDALASIPALADLDTLRRKVLIAASGGADPIEDRETLYRVFAHSVRASQTAPSVPYVGSLRLFVPMDGNRLVPGYREVLEAYWRTVALGSVTVDAVPGGHFDCLGDHLADRLQESHR